jgi:hypothetical protein
MDYRYMPLTEGQMIYNLDRVLSCQGDVDENDAPYLDPVLANLGAYIPVEMDGEGSMG